MVRLAHFYPSSNIPSSRQADKQRSCAIRIHPFRTSRHDQLHFLCSGRHFAHLLPLTSAWSSETRGYMVEEGGSGVCLIQVDGRNEPQFVT
jgi:hypothetical protein